jgi:hypothetical protein
MVHGGPRAGARPGLTGEFTGQHHAAPKLTVRSPIARGGHGEPHQQNGGQRGGLTQRGDDETKRWQTELSVTANGARRRVEKESAR